MSGKSFLAVERAHRLSEFCFLQQEEAVADYEIEIKLHGMNEQTCKSDNDGVVAAGACIDGSKIIVSFVVSIVTLFLMQ